MTGIILIIVGFLATTTVLAQQPDSEILKLMPEIPANISEPAKRAEYLALHYWDNFDFGDMASPAEDDLFERCFVDFIDVLSMVQADKPVYILMYKAAEANTEMLRLVIELSEKYLYRPESPVYDEEKFIPFLQFALQSDALDETLKIRPKFLLDNVMKNRTGHAANDFSYTLINRDSGTLYGVKTNYTILFFKDPECEDCTALAKLLATSSTINGLIEQGKMTILTVYTGDDIESWEKHASEIPASWIYSFDEAQKIVSEEIYDIKRYPTLYLLDKDKKVLLKDVGLQKIEEYIAQ